MYCFGGNHRYSIFEDLWETLGAAFGAILGATLDANFGRRRTGLVCAVVVVIPFEPKQRAPCWVFTTEFFLSESDSGVIRR